MKNITLNHKLTPHALEEVNAELSAMLQEEPLVTELFLALITRRDEIVRNHLSELNKEHQKAFSELEIPINNALLKQASQFQKHSLKQLSGLLKGQKAVKKYE